MATLWIREYSQTGTAGTPDSAGLGKLQVAHEPGTDQSAVTFSTSAQSAAFAAGTKYIAIIGSASFHYVVGANPTATTGALKVPADTLLFIGVTPGQKIAAIAAA
ncbi:MAG: hypothetical protein AB7R40_23520 [Nitrospiraceae bacterium]